MALKNALKAIRIYKRSLPSAHPNNALAQVILANIYLGMGEYDAALKNYNQAIKLLETALPGDHPDFARSIHNLGLVYERQDNLSEATESYDQALSIAERTLSAEHPLFILIQNSRERISKTSQSYVTVRL